MTCCVAADAADRFAVRGHEIFIGDQIVEQFMCALHNITQVLLTVSPILSNCRRVRDKGAALGPPYFGFNIVMPSTPELFYLTFINNDQSASKNWSYKLGDGVSCDGLHGCVNFGFPAAVSN
jgi:hypothetical protein